MKITNDGIALILMTLFFFYEYMFRGLKVLVNDKEITLFPDNFYIFFTRILFKIEIPYRHKREKMVAYVGVFLSGMFYAFLMFFFIGKFSSTT